MRNSIHNALSLRLVLRLPTSQAQNATKNGPFETEFFLFILQIFSFIWIKYKIGPISIIKPLKITFFAANRQCRYLRHYHSNQPRAVLGSWRNLSLQGISWIINRYHLIFWNLTILFVCTNTVFNAKWPENAGNCPNNFLLKTQTTLAMTSLRWVRLRPLN